MKKLNLKKNKKGFTLVEIIVVLVIMGILLAIAVPSVMGYVGKAKNQQYIAQARNGFLGATTIVANENAKETPLADRSELTKALINVEIGETASGMIEAAACKVEATAANVYVVKKCEITVKDKKDSKITFTANDEAVMTDEAAVDTAAEYKEFVAN